MFVEQSHRGPRCQGRNISVWRRVFLSLREKHLLLPPTQSKKQGQCRRSQLSVFSFLSHCFIFLSSASHFKLTSFYVIVTYHWEPDEGLPLHHGKCAPKGWGCALWHGAEFLYFRQFCTNVSVTALANDRNILRTYAPYSHGGHFPLTSHSGWGISTPASEETYFKVK